MIIVSQLLVVGLFFTTIFNDEVRVDKYVSTSHNKNLNKIATSVSLLFEQEELDDKGEIPVVGLVEEVPLVDITKEDESLVDDSKNDKNEESKVEEVAVPLYSIAADKYIDNVAMGFKVTEDNKQYSLEGHEFDVVVAVVAGEFDKNLNDALGVVSVILNRCDSKKWSTWAGDNPYKQVTMKGQFEVYFKDLYLSYMPGGSQYGSEKYNIAKQAVLDGINGIRNNNYLGFRAWWITSYSDNYIIPGGNRYGYN